MYDIQFTKEAENFFNKLDKPIQKEIAKKIDSLKENPKLGKPLTANLSGMWSLRIGKFRVIYTVKNKELVILVVEIGHRKKVY